MNCYIANTLFWELRQDNLSSNEPANAVVYLYCQLSLPYIYNTLEIVCFLTHFLDYYAAVVQLNAVRWHTADLYGKTCNI